MKGNMCRLYDEQLVRNIMIATGLTVFEHMAENGTVDPKEVCEFIEMHADTIIEDTILDMNSLEEGNEQDSEDDGGEDDDWSAENDSAAV